MTRDPPPPAADDADRELSSLFATLKDDQAPADLEARLLEGLAATAAASAGAAAVKSGLGHKIALWLGTSGLGKSMLVGALCGGAVCGAISVVDSPPGSAPPAAELSSAVRPPDHPTLSAAGAPDPNKPYSDESHRPSPGAPAPEAAPPAGDGQARTPTPASVSAAPSSAGVPGGSAESAAGLEPSPGAEPAAPGTPSPAPSLSSSPSTSGSAASDGLRRELLHVRGISALVDAGRCAEARAAIAAYRGEHRTGQLAGEVDVLAARCQGR